MSVDSDGTASLVSLREDVPVSHQYKLQVHFSGARTGHPEDSPVEPSEVVIEI